MSKPINATKSLTCDHCIEKKVRNLYDKEVIRYICDFVDITPTWANTYSKPCTMYDWNRCEKNEDK